MPTIGRSCFAGRRSAGVGPWPRAMDDASTRNRRSCPSSSARASTRSPSRPSRLADGLSSSRETSRRPGSDLEELTRQTASPPRPRRGSRVEQVSSVEHATVLGVPRRAADGRAIIGAGLGRPLILSTLERDEAMRVLTGGAIGRSRLAVACLAAGAIAHRPGRGDLVARRRAVRRGVASALAASPDPTPPAGHRHAHQRRRSRASSASRCWRSSASSASRSLSLIAASLAYVRLTGRAGGGTEPPA